MTPPWNKIDMTEAVINATGIPFDKIDSDEEAIEAAKKYGMVFENEADWSRGKIIAEMFGSYLSVELDKAAGLGIPIKQ